MSIKRDPVLEKMVLEYAKSSDSDRQPIQKTAGEVRFIKENANENGLWAYGGSAPANREITPKFDFQVKNLKPIVDCMKYSAASLSYAMVAYDIFTKLPSASISPDGRLGGKGYIMKIQDIRKNFMNIVEALSSMTDTFYDELQAPHWAAQTREMDPELKEELNIALEDTEKIRTDPENWALTQFDELTGQPAISKSTDGTDDNLVKPNPMELGVPKPEIVDPRIKKPISSTSPKPKSTPAEPVTTQSDEEEWIGDIASDIDVPPTPPPVSKPASKPAKAKPQPPKSPASNTLPPPSANTMKEEDEWLDKSDPEKDTTAVVKLLDGQQKYKKEKINRDWLTEGTEEGVSDGIPDNFFDTDGSEISPSVDSSSDEVNEDDWLNSPMNPEPDIDSTDDMDWLSAPVTAPPPVQKAASSNKNDEWKRYLSNRSNRS